MNVSQVDLKSSDPTALLEELKRIVNLRNKMGGSLYWNVLNDDAREIASRLCSLGISAEIIDSILTD